MKTPPSSTRHADQVAHYARLAASEQHVSSVLTPTPTTSQTQTDALLNERETTHGDFYDNAYYAQAIKLLKTQSKAIMTEVQHEAFDFIASKLARILSGQASFADHWRDISGYAMLVVRELENGH